VNLKRAAIYALALFLISGCGAGLTTQEVEAINKRLARVEKSLGESDARVEELESKFSLLREKFDAKESDSQALLREEVTPPEGLKVIRLGDATLTVKGLPGEERGTAVKVDGRTVIKEKRPLLKAGAPIKRGSAPAVKGTGGHGREAKPLKTLYKKGRNLYLAGSYNEARAVFASILQLYPESSYADNALYWSGESFYRDKDYTAALKMFSSVVERYPNGNKVADALLMIGTCQDKLGRRSDAAAVYKKLVDKYPRSEAAKTASNRLKAL